MGWRRFLCQLWNSWPQERLRRHAQTHWLGLNFRHFIKSKHIRQLALKGLFIIILITSLRIFVLGVWLSWLLFPSCFGRFLIRNRCSPFFSSFREDFLSPFHTNLYFRISWWWAKLKRSNAMQCAYEFILVFERWWCWSADPRPVVGNT